jgi:hypothetical protein
LVTVRVTHDGNVVSEGHAACFISTDFNAILRCGGLQGRLSGKLNFAFFSSNNDDGVHDDDEDDNEKK